jgi:hypothetical protein
MCCCCHAANERCPAAALYVLSSIVHQRRTLPGSISHVSVSHVLCIHSSHGRFKALEGSNGLPKDVVEPPKFITGKHVAAIFEKLGFDATCGQKVGVLLFVGTHVGGMECAVG